jgi:Sec-independent protein secretion pathway components
MFGSIGFPELLLVFIVVLLVFGPGKLPEFAKLLGKFLREFRSTVDQAKSAIQDEIYKEGMADHMKDISRDVREALNITGDLGREVKDALDAGGTIRRELKDALDIYGIAEPKPAPGAEEKDDEKKD